MRKGEIPVSRMVVGFLKAGRGVLHWSQEDLAQESGVSIATIKRFESRINSITELALQEFEKNKTVPVRQEKIAAILKAFDLHGVAIERDNFGYKLSVRSEEINKEFDTLIYEIASESKNRKQYNS